jgi:hypothetical protein
VRFPPNEILTPLAPKQKRRNPTSCGKREEGDSVSADARFSSREGIPVPARSAQEGRLRLSKSPNPSNGKRVGITTMPQQAPVSTRAKESQYRREARRKSDGVSAASLIPVSGGIPVALGSARERRVYLAEPTLPAARANRIPTIANPHRTPAP